MGADDDASTRGSHRSRSSSARPPTPSCRRSGSASATSWPPTALGGAVEPQPEGQQIGLLDVGLDRRRGRRPAARSAVHPAPRSPVELRRRRRAARRCHGAAPRPPTARSRRPASPRRCGACSCTPRSTTDPRAWDRLRPRLARDGASTPTPSCARSRRRARSSTTPGSRSRRGFAALARRARPGDDATGGDQQGQPAAAGLPRPGTPRWSPSAALGDAAEPLLALLARTADPDQALAQLVRLAEAAPDDPAALLQALVADDEGTAMRLLCVLGASEALGDHLVRHPEHWRELTDPTLGSTRPAAFAVRADLLAVVGADPDDADPDRDRLRTPRPSTRCGWSTAGSCCASPPATWPTTSASTTRPPSCPTSPPAPSRPRWRRPPARGRGRGRDAAGGDRDGQVRWPRAQLRLRRRRDLRLRAGRGRRGLRIRPGRHPAREPAHAGVLRPDDRGHDLAGRRQPASGGQGRPAGPHAGQPPRLLRALGQDLGVPGAAQGPAGRR